MSSSAWTQLDQSHGASTKGLWWQAHCTSRTDKETNLKQFLTNDENKTQFIKVILDVWSWTGIATELVSRKIIVVSEGHAYELQAADGSHTIERKEVLSLLSTQEEKDTHIILYCNLPRTMAMSMSRQWHLLHTSTLQTQDDNHCHVWHSTCKTWWILGSKPSIISSLKEFTCTLYGHKWLTSMDKLCYSLIKENCSSEDGSSKLNKNVYLSILPPCTQVHMFFFNTSVMQTTKCAYGEMQIQSWLHLSATKKFAHVRRSWQTSGKFWQISVKANIC